MIWNKYYILNVKYKLHYLNFFKIQHISSIRMFIIVYHFYFNWEEQIWLS